jgi:16S rRNA processing protein RimM
VSEPLVPVGRVGKPHGLDGSFVVERGSEDPGRYAVGATLIVDGRPTTVTSSRRVGGGRFAIRLDRSVPRGTELAVRRRDLPPPDEGAYYVADLIGLTVLEAEGVRLGVVTDVLERPGNDALELDTGILLPMIDDCVLEIDQESATIVVAPGFGSDG